MKKYILYLFGLNILAIGIVLNLKTGLGVAALSSTIYVCSIIFSISLGLSSIIWYLFFILIQSILCKKIKKEFLLEIPLSIVFGFLTDFYSFLFQSIEFNYPFLLLIFALLCISLGVYCTTITNLVLNPGDGIVKTISEVYRVPFCNVKNGFDISLLLISIILSLFFEGKIMGIGIGTIVSSICIGRLIQGWSYIFSNIKW